MPDPLIPPLGDGDHAWGAPDAPLELVMYGDFECPYCAAAQGILRRVRERLTGRLTFSFRHFPLRDVHPDAQRAAEAREAAGARDFFWDMHDDLYALGGRLALDDLAGAAESIGLVPDQVRQEVLDGTHTERVARDVRSGEASGVRGTPTFFVNGVRHEGAFDAQSLIAALEGA